MTLNAADFAQWYVLIYLVPGGVALLLLLLSALGGGMHHHHAGIGHGGHHGLGHHGAGHPGGGHHTASHAAPHAGQPAHSHTGHKSTGHKSNAAVGRSAPLLTFFGLGRVPAPLVWGSALLGWGVFGFWGTQWWQSLLHWPVAFVPPALLTAVAGALLTEKVTVETAARYLPRDETYAVSSVDLCGLTGTVVFPADAARGRIHVYDTHGTLHDVAARTDGSVIVRGQSVLVADYDAARDQFIVEELP